MLKKYNANVPLEFWSGMRNVFLESLQVELYLVENLTISQNIGSHINLIINYNIKKIMHSKHFSTAWEQKVPNCLIQLLNLTKWRPFKYLAWRCFVTWHSFFLKHLSLNNSQSNTPVESESNMAYLKLFPGFFKVCVFNPQDPYYCKCVSSCKFCETFSFTLSY